MRYDTRYRTSNYSSNLPAGVKWLVIANTGMFLLSYLGPSLAPSLDEHLLMLALAPAAVLKHFAIWQLVTYMFLHGGVWHILLNMLALWMFGSPLERDWGTRRFLQYYFLCGIGA